VSTMFLAHILPCIACRFWSYSLLVMEMWNGDCLNNYVHFLLESLK
jgi:hypothetical protein